MPRYATLLSLDLDGTILGESEREILFRSWALGRPKKTALAYATGRSIASVREEISRGRLPPPDFIIGHLGCDIERGKGPASDLMASLFACVSPDWKAEKVMRAGIGPGVEPQESIRLNDYKASFYWDGKPESLYAFRERIASILPEGSWRLMEVERRFLDVLPSCVGKATATLAVMRSLGLERENVIVAGDSENDQDLFAEPGFKKILPSNAIDLLRRLAPEAYASPYPDAAGVLDGLRHFGII